MVDSAISTLGEAPEALSDEDLTIISQNVNDTWVSVKLTMGQLKTFIRFGLDIDSIFGLPAALGSKAGVTHSHGVADITGLTIALNDKAPTAHGHQISSITGLENELDGKADADHVRNELDGKADVDHVHSVSGVTGLENELDGKADVDHVHSVSGVTGLVDELDGKADADHVHSISGVTGLDAALTLKLDADKVGVANGVASLDVTGKIPTSQLHDTFVWIILADTLNDFPQPGTEGVLYIDKTSNITYRWDGSDYIATTADIVQLELGDNNDQAYPGDKGKTAYDHSQTDHAPADAQKNSDITIEEIEAKLIGEVTSHTHTIGSVAGLDDALDSKAPTAHGHEISEINGLPDVLDALLPNSLLNAPEGLPTLDENSLLRLTQFPDLNFILEPESIVVEEVIQSSGGILIPDTRPDIVVTGDVFSGDLSSPTNALEFAYEWLGENPATLTFIQGESVELRFIETDDILTDTSDHLIVKLEYNDVDIGNGDLERQAKITVSNSLFSEEGLAIVGEDGNNTALRLERDDGVLSLYLDNFPVLTVDAGVVFNFMHFIEVDNTLTSLSYAFVNTSLTVYNLPFDLENGKLYRVSVECEINSRKLYPGDCFFFYSNKTRIIILRSSSKQQQLEEAILSHGHVISQVQGLGTQLDGIATALNNKSNTGHVHLITDITGLAGELTGLYSAVAGKAATAHTHVINDITGLATALSTLTSSVDGKAATAHTHTIANVTGLQAALNAKAATSHTHPEITAETILLTEFNVATNPERPATGDSIQTVIEKMQRQLDLLSRFSQNVFEPSNDFPYVEADGTLYRFNSGTITDNQSTQNVTLAPGYYRLIAGAPCEYTGGVIDLIGKWVRVYKASDSGEVYVSQETMGEDALIVGGITSKGNDPFGYIGGVGYKSNLVFPYLFKQIEELHRGLDGTSPDLGTRNGAISVSLPLIVPVPLDVTLLIGANVTAAADEHGGFVWIRELLPAAIVVPNGFVLTNGIYNGTILGWDEFGTIEITPDTFNGYQAHRPNSINEVVVYTVPDLGTPTGDVTYNIGLRSGDESIKFIEVVYTSTGGGSLTVKENGVDLFGELFGSLPAKIKIRTISSLIFEVALLDGSDVITHQRTIFTDGENANRFYLEGLFVEAADVEPTLVTVDGVENTEADWISSGSINDFVNKIHYWNRSNQFNIGTVGSPILIDQYSTATSISTDYFVEFDVTQFDNVGVKSIDIYLAVSSNITTARTTNVGHISLFNVDNSGSIVTTLKDFVTADLVDGDALAIDSIKLSRTSDTEVVVDYVDGAPVASNTFTVVAGGLFVHVEVRTDTGVEIINLPYNVGTA
jgi:hypothetical protein